ncbi:MAG: peptidoglycan-binding domain-containing protein, partial [Nocardioides sp.]
MKAWSAPVSLALASALALSLADTFAPASLAGAQAAGAARWTLRDPFSREIVRPGDIDTDPYHIEHVYEVQYRLRRLGLFDAVPNGHFGPITRAGVEKFQTSIGLETTGTVDHRTWLDVGHELDEQRPDPGVDVGDDATHGRVVLPLGVVQWPVPVAGSRDVGAVLAAAHG